MDTLRKLAEEQHAVVSRVQCRSLEVDLENPFERGEWESLSPRVIRLIGAPRTARSDVMAAVLDAGIGAAASRRTAAALWGLPGFDLDRPEVTRPYGVEQFRPTLGRLHRTRLLPPHHVTTVEGIPVTTLPPALHRMLPELAERGRTGITLMRERLADRPAGYIAPASGLEARFVHLLEEAGIPTRRQVDLGGDGWIGRVDLQIPGTNLVVEVDSARFHTSRLDRERDARRDAELRAAGYEVVRVTEEEVWYARSVAVRRVLTAYRRAA